MNKEKNNSKIENKDLKSGQDTKKESIYEPITKEELGKFRRSIPIKGKRRMKDPWEDQLFEGSEVF